METGSVIKIGLVLALSVLVLLAVSLSVSALFEYVAGLKLQGRKHSKLQGSEKSRDSTYIGKCSDLLHKALPGLYGLGLTRMESWLPPKFMQRVTFHIKSAGCQFRSVEGLAVCLVHALFIFVLISLLVRTAVAGMVGVVALLFLASLMLEKRKTAHAKEIHTEIPSLLRSLDTALRSGYTLSQAFAYAEKGCTEHLKEEIKCVSESIQIGCTIPESLRTLASRTTFYELELIAIALEVQHRSGGSPHDIIEAVSQSIKESESLQRALEVKTAQSKMSSLIIGIVPVALVILLSIISNEYATSLFQTTQGSMILASALLMNVVGFLWIRKILAIDVV